MKVSVKRISGKLVSVAQSVEGVLFGNESFIKLKYASGDMLYIPAQDVEAIFIAVDERDE